MLKQILEANLDIVSSARAAADPAVTSRRASVDLQRVNGSGWNSLVFALIHFFHCT